eukprot:12590246-Alexandrium_andersonii.AAC.1
MSASLVGSEMCIRDSCWINATRSSGESSALKWPGTLASGWPATARTKPVSYTHLTLPTICSV